MSRYNRINIDGKGVSRTALVGAAAITPGSLVKLSGAGAFVAHSTAGKKGDFIYAMHPDALQGATCDTAVAIGATGVGEIAETGRELAMLVAATTVLVLDSPLTSNGAGALRLAVIGTDEIIAYSQEVFTVPATAQLVRVRIA